MAHVIADRVKETTATTGTGALTLDGAATGFVAFSAVTEIGDSCYYGISSSGGAEWEIGIGRRTGASTLSRDTVIKSSNSDALVNLSGGAKDVFITVPSFSINTHGTEFAMSQGAWGV